MNRPRGDRLHYCLLYRAVSILNRVIQRLPLTLVAALGRISGLLLFVVSHKLRRRALANVARCPVLPEATDVRKLVRRSCVHLGLTVLESIKLAHLTPEAILEMIDFEGLEYLVLARQAGRGVIFITGHIGNWELLAAGVTLKGFPTRPIVKPQRGSAIDRMINDNRRRLGMRPIPLGFSLRELVSSLRANEVIGVLMDQNANEFGVESVFLGRQSKSPRGAAVLALKTGAPVLTGHARRTGPWKFKLTVYPPVEVIVTGDFEADVAANTDRFNQALTDQILEAPEQWLWTYNRQWLPAADPDLSSGRRAAASPS